MPAMTYVTHEPYMCMRVLTFVFCVICDTYFYLSSNERKPRQALAREDHRKSGHVACVLCVTAISSLQDARLGHRDLSKIWEFVPIFPRSTVHRD